MSSLPLQFGPHNDPLAVFLYTPNAPSGCAEHALRFLANAGEPRILMPFPDRCCYQSIREYASRRSTEVNNTFAYSGFRPPPCQPCLEIRLGDGMLAVAVWVGIHVSGPDGLSVVQFARSINLDRAEAMDGEELTGTRLWQHKRNYTRFVPVDGWE